MYAESIEEKTKSILGKIALQDFAGNFYLAGGTALAIQLGHRRSIDLDWFSQKDFSPMKLKSALAKLGKLEIASEEKGTLHGILDEVRITFLLYEYAPLYPLIKFRNILLADARDIAAMKIDAISSRGSRKDFIDLFFLLEKYSLQELLGFFEKKYQNINFNKMHILKSLVFFEDADNEPMPEMLKKINWQDVRERIIKEVNGLSGIN